MKKAVKKSTHHDKAADPVKVPKKQVDESKALEEAVTPKADAVPAAFNCGECTHEEDKHYGSVNRWCNVAGCQCQAYRR